MENRAGSLIIISGKVGAGKSSLVARLVSGFADLGWQIRGVRSPAIFENGEKVGIAAIDLSTNVNKRLAGKNEKKSPLSDHPLIWRFDEEVLQWGNQVFANAVPCDLLVVDEIGPLELERGQGWQNVLAALDSRRYHLAILVMRPALLESALSRWHWGEVVMVQNVSEIGVFAAQLLKRWTK